MTRPAYHFTLADGVTTLKFLCSDPSGQEQSLTHWQRSPLDKSAMKLGSGRTKYDDLLPPWYSIAQDDWSGGRGSLELSDDPTEYWDADGAQAWIPKRLVLGPQTHREEGLPLSADWGWDDPDGWLSVPAAQEQDDMVGQTFTPAGNMTARGVSFKYRYTEETTPVYLSVHLVGTTAGVPDMAKPMAVGMERIEPDTSGTITVMFNVPAELVGSTIYAVVIYGALSAYSPDVRYHVADEYTGVRYFYDYELETWTPKTGDVAMSILEEGYTVRFFNYLSLLNAMVDCGDMGTEILRRGKLGKAAVAGERRSITVATGHGTGAVGETVHIVDATGKGQWAIVVAVDGDKLTIDRDWGEIPDTTSIYALTGPWVSYFTIANGKVTDVCVVDGIVYVSRGASDPVRHYHWTNAGGDTWEDDGTNKADVMLEFRDKDNDPAIWKALGNEIAAASIVEWGTNLTFGTAIRCGSSDSSITALTVYDDHLYICKDDALLAIEDEIVRRIPVDFSALRSPNNGRNMTSWNLYLIWPLQQGLQRLYGTEVDDFGPNQARGLAEGRQGWVSAILPLPGQLVVGIDAGDDNTSSVMIYNNLGWHTLAVAGEVGKRVTSLFYETLADASGRLWWNEGSDVCWAWMSGRIFDRSRDSRADWPTSGTLTSSWLGTDLQDVVKLWRRVVVIKEEDETVTGLAAVSVEYRLDDESASWSSASVVSQTDTRDEFSLGNVIGRRLQLRLTLTRGGSVDDGYTTPEIRAIAIDALGRIKTAHSFGTHSTIDTIAVSMQGEPERRDPPAVLATLDGWAATPTPLTLTHVLPEFDSLTVLLEPTEVRVSDYVGQGALLATRVVSVNLIELN